MSIPISVFDAMVQEPFFVPRSGWEMMGHHQKKSGLNACRPQMDIWTQPGGTMIVQVELPGLNKTDVSIEINENVMSISGKKDSYKCQCEGCTCNHQERNCGSFIRRVQVAYGLKPDEVKAEMDNGLLKIKVPKVAKENESRKIDIS